jgi:hypothetical protein
MKESEYVKKIQGLDWKELSDLWKEIKSGSPITGWESGKAFEYLIPRIFELDKVQVKYPFEVKMPYNEKTMEQIDGVIYPYGMPVLIESKDYNDGDGGKKNIGIEPIAKLRNQLSRRPYNSIGCVYSSGGFTEAVANLIDYLGNETILLWQGEEVEMCIQKMAIKEFFRIKYEMRVEHGIQNFNVATPKI